MPAPPTLSAPPPQLDWDEYEPASAEEFDLCPACCTAADHSVAQHISLVDEARAAQSRRDEALHRHARLVYETDRL